MNIIKKFEPVERIELSTSSLPRKRSTPELHWRGAEDEVRTRDPQLGRLMLYQLSYFRVFLRKPRVSWLRLGIESFYAPDLHKNSAIRYFKEKPFRASFVGKDGFEPP